MNANESMISHRENEQFRILTGLTILFVVSGHLSGNNFLTIYGWFPFYSFHLPLFIFISGYFFKKEVSYVNYVCKKIINHLVPFFLIRLILSLIQTYLARYHSFCIGSVFSFKCWLVYPFIRRQPDGFSVATWFIIMLLGTQLIHKTIICLFRIERFIKDFILLVIYFAVGLLLIYLAVKKRLFVDVDLWWVYLRMFIVLPFFQLGYMYRTYWEKKDNVNDYWYFGIVFLIQSILWINNTNLNFGLWGNLEEFEKGGLVFFISAVNGIAFWLRASRILQTSSRIIRGVLVLLGKSSMYIMYFHLLSYWLVNSIIYLLHKREHFYDFDAAEYHSNVYYSYHPSHIWFLVYIIVGIVVPVCIYLVVNRIGACIKEKHKRTSKT